MKPEVSTVEIGLIEVFEVQSPNESSNIFFEADSWEFLKETFVQILTKYSAGFAAYLLQNSTSFTHINFLRLRAHRICKVSKFSYQKGSVCDLKQTSNYGTESE
ncbi:hypothetical protein ACTXT7_006205 [Hymenolepis weldensis]